MLFLSTLIICATVIWLAREAKPFLTRKLALEEKEIENVEKLATLEKTLREQERQQDSKFRLQEIDLKAQELALKDKEVSRPSPVKPAAPPEDLIRHAMSEAAPWAQEDALKRLYELYDMSQDWATVRSIYDLETSR